MKYLITSYLISIAIFYGGNIDAHDIININSSFENNKIIITYDLVNTNNNAVYRIGLDFKDEKGRYLIPQAQFLSGDYGYIKGGHNKRIVWDIANEYDDLVINIKPILKITETKNFMGGPQNAFLSVVVPGLGKHKVYEHKSVINFTTISSYSLIGYGILSKLYSDASYNKYKEAADENELDKYYNRTNIFNYHFYIATGLGAACWITDIVVVTIKGFKNTNEKNQYIRFDNLSYDIEYYNGLKIKLVYKF